MKVFLAETSSRPYLYANLFGGRQWEVGVYQSRVEGGGRDMDIYLAGGITGNLNPLWKSIAGGGQNELISRRGTYDKEYPCNNRNRGGAYYT